MRALLTILLVSGTAWGQATDMAKPADASAPATRTSQSNSAPQIKERSAAPAETPVADIPDPNLAVIPAGTKIPLSLAQAISTKNAREGDPVYAETTFPFVMNERVVVAAGAYISGEINGGERAGRIKGRAEILMHFTSMIFPSGYTVMLPGSVQNTPGAEKTSVKDSEGTIRHDRYTGKKVEEAAKGGVYGGSGGALAGALAGGLNGARVGAGTGAAAGIAWALLKRGSDVRLEVGTSIEMEILRAISIDGSRSRRFANLTR